jgi:hypothetical protein
MGDFDFLQQPTRQQRPAAMPPLPRPAVANAQPSVSFPASSSHPIRSPAKEKFLGVVIVLLKICAALYLVLAGVGVIGIVVSVATRNERNLDDLFRMLFIGAGGALACMAFAELIQLAIRAVRALEETAAILRATRRS